MHERLSYLSIEYLYSYTFTGHVNNPLSYFKDREKKTHAHVMLADISCWKILLLCPIVFLFYQRFIYQKKDWPNRFHKVIVFGDSFSYTGNETIKYNESFHPNTNRFQDRFCDDIIWLERLDVREKHSYALPGATSDNDLFPSFGRFQGPHVPSVRQQISSYLINTSKNQSDITQPLYIIWIGFNDYEFNQKSTRPRQIVKSIMHALNDLLVVGAKNFLIFNQAPLQVFPCNRYANRRTFYREQTFLFNTQFRRGLATLKQTYSNASIHMFDYHTLLTEIVSNRASHRFNDTINPCFQLSKTFAVQKYCFNPKQYVFLDSVHVTSAVHQLITDAIQPFLSTHFKENDPESYIYSF